MTEIRLMCPPPGAAATWVVFPAKYGYELSPKLYVHTFTSYTLSTLETTHLARKLTHRLQPLWAQDRQQARAHKRARSAKRAAFRRRKQGRA